MSWNVIKQSNRLRRSCFENNHALYQAVFLPKGISFEQNDSIWYSLEKPPPLYSNIVTRSPEWQPDEIFREIDQRFESEGWDEWTIKDSFGVLNLEPYGFTKLFDAQWIYLDQNNIKPTLKDTDLKWKIVPTTDELDRWLLAWDDDESIGKQIFSSQMLDDPDLKFMAGFEDTNLISGCLLNRSDDVIGISNFFAPASRTRYWSQMIEFILTQTATDLAGYSRNPEEWTQLGFETIGPLTVWIKRK